VNFYDAIMDSHRYQKPFKTLKFGNENASNMQRVKIDVYGDKVDLHCAAEGYRHHKRNVDLYKEYTDEQLIIIAIDEWINYFYK
jgi:extradiol dioxygenase family protein